VAEGRVVKLTSSLILLTPVCTRYGHTVSAPVDGKMKGKQFKSLTLPSRQVLRPPSPFSRPSAAIYPPAGGEAVWVPQENFITDPKKARNVARYTTCVRVRVRALARTDRLRQTCLNTVIHHFIPCFNKAFKFMNLREKAFAFLFSPPRHDSAPVVQVPTRVCVRACVQAGL
jgi:hypothetical protein